MMINTQLKLILLLAVILRVAAAFYLGNQVTPLPGISDQVSYHNLALRVLAGHGFTFGEPWWPVTDANAPTAHWSYLYTFYLVIIYTIFGPFPLAARLIQAVVVGLLQPYLAYRLSDQIIPPLLAYRQDRRGDSSDNTTIVMQRVSLYAAGITAIYTYFIYYAAALMTEAFFITALMGSFVIAITLTERVTKSPDLKWAVALGLTLSSAVLLRQLFLLFIPFLFLWLILSTYKRGGWPRTLLSIFIATTIITIAILPITAYNYVRFNRFVLLNTNSGYVLFWANHPIQETQFKSASQMGETYQKLVPAELRSLDEAALDQALLKRGIEFVLNDPERYLYLSLSRIPAYFKFWPENTSGLLSNIARVSSFALFLPFMLYGLLRSLINQNRLPARRFFIYPFTSTTLLYLFIVLYTAIHVLSWALIRYRLPVDAILITFAALGIADLGQFVENFGKRRKYDKGKNSSGNSLTVDQG